MNGIKGKERVKKHGEVFTPDRIVVDMLDLTTEDLRNEGYTDMQMIAATYMEPACGNGNILLRILDEKLKNIAKLNLTGEAKDKALVRAVSSVYGVDIQADNVGESITRMLELIKFGKPNLVLKRPNDEDIPWCGELGWKCDDLSDDMKKTLMYILVNNITCGNTLEPVLASGKINNADRVEEQFIKCFDKTSVVYGGPGALVDVADATDVVMDNKFNNMMRQYCYTFNGDKVSVVSSKFNVNKATESGFNQEDEVKIGEAAYNKLYTLNKYVFDFGNEDDDCGDDF